MMPIADNAETPERVLAMLRQQLSDVKYQISFLSSLQQRRASLEKAIRYLESRAK